MLLKRNFTTQIRTEKKKSKNKVLPNPWWSYYRAITRILTVIDLILWNFLCTVINKLN